MVIAGVILAVLIVVVFVGQHKNAQPSAPGISSSGDAKKLYEEAVRLVSAQEGLAAH